MFSRNGARRSKKTRTFVATCSVVFVAAPQQFELYWQLPMAPFECLFHFLLELQRKLLMWLALLVGVRLNLRVCSTLLYRLMIKKWHFYWKPSLLGLPRNASLFYFKSRWFLLVLSSWLIRFLASLRKFSSRDLFMVASFEGYILVNISNPIHHDVPCVSPYDSRFIPVKISQI